MLQATKERRERKVMRNVLYYGLETYLIKLDFTKEAREELLKRAKDLSVEDLKVLTDDYAHQWWQYKCSEMKEGDPFPFDD